MDTTKERLREIMREKNINQTELAKRCQPWCKEYGIRLGTTDISAYVTGKYLPAQRKLTILSLALDVSEAWLMGLDVPKERKHPVTDEYAPMTALDRVKLTKLERDEITDLTDDERRLVEIYRACDLDGRDTVRACAIAERRRTEVERKKDRNA